VSGPGGAAQRLTPGSGRRNTNYHNHYGQQYASDTEVLMGGWQAHRDQLCLQDEEREPQRHHQATCRRGGSSGVPSTVLR